MAQIAKRFGFHHTTVARHLKQAGETLRTDPADPAFQERVRQAYSSGWLSTPPGYWASVRIWCGMGELRPDAAYDSA